ncbi:MAG: hypothetical protein O7F71_05040 [Gammaproteobacteria bacterium]|nr:hypothetical protein [Gammaproteobacteria bacterium]
MTTSQLKGRIFAKQGTSYLVVDENDWSADMLNVRAIDPGKKLSQMPREEILQLVQNGYSGS